MIACWLVQRYKMTFYHIVIRFRFFKIPISAEIGEMYRPIELDNNQNDFHRILWRELPSQPIETYRRTRVTATHITQFDVGRSLQGKRTSRFKPRMLSTDIFMSMISSLVLHPKLKRENSTDPCLTLSSKHSFELRKRTCSNPSIVLDLPHKYREANEDLKILDVDHTIKTLKTLGITWNPSCDVSSFHLSQLEEDLGRINMITKRRMLSKNAKTFDPLRSLSPVRVKLKLKWSVANMFSHYSLG